MIARPDPICPWDLGREDFIIESASGADFVDLIKMKYNDNAQQVNQGDGE